MTTALYTENPRFSHLVKDELWAHHGFTRAVVTYNGTAGNLLIGTVLGKVTATGKYKVSLQAAADGSQTPDAILIEDKLNVALNTDTNMMVLLRGPAIVSKAALLLDSSFSTAPQKAAAYAALEAKQIQVNDAV